MERDRKSEETGRVAADEILPEYDFSRARANKYASRYAAGSIVVVLDPDVETCERILAESNGRSRSVTPPVTTRSL